MSVLGQNAAPLCYAFTLGFTCCGCLWTYTANCCSLVSGQKMLEKSVVLYPTTAGDRSFMGKMAR